MKRLQVSILAVVLIIVACAMAFTALKINHPLEGWDEAAYLASRLRNKRPRFVVERAVRMTFRLRVASF